MKLFFSLNQPLECGKLCSEVTKAIHQYIADNGNLSNAVMVIELKESLENKEICSIEYCPPSS